MTDPEMMLDGEVPVDGQVVVRLSRTATGTRTYTVGLSLPLLSSDAQRVDALTRLFAVDDAVRDRIDRPRTAVAPSTAADASRNTERALRLSLLLERMRQTAATPGVATMATDAVAMGTSFPGHGWLTAADLMTEGVTRTRLINDLHALVGAGLIDYQRGGGKARPSFYRVKQEVTK